jgi:hypothetical protein
MNHPDFKASQAEWQKWADENYPFDGRGARGAVGFDVVRATPDRLLAADLALGVCRSMLPTQRGVTIPPMPEWMKQEAQQPEAQTERNLFGDHDRW